MSTQIESPLKGSLGHLLDRGPAQRCVIGPTNSAGDSVNLRGVTRDPGSATDFELRLARILAEGFGRESVDPDDNFFDLGGNSLLAAGFLAQVAEEFGQHLSLDALLERPTVRLLAELLR